MRKKSEPSRLQKEDYELLAEFRYTLRRFLRFSENAAKEYKLTPQKYQALLAIEGFPGRNYVTVGELAEQLQIAPHSTVGMVDRLVKSRLVKRTPASDDRRIVWVSLTPLGLELLEKLYRVHRTELHSVGPRLSTLLRKAARSMPTEK
ncbi:helix-turn-helix domain-containing protein [soil metagenome]